MNKKRMKTRVRRKDVPKNLQGKAAFLLAELLLLKIGINPDKNRPLLEETIMKAEQETVVSLAQVPKRYRGKAAEVLVQFRILTFGIDSCRYPKSVKDKDLDVWNHSVENATKIFIQVKSCSLRLHDKAFHVDETPLASFRGWYIVLVEHEPDDVFYFIPDSKVQKYIEENKGNKEKVRHDPNRKRWYVEILGNEADFDEYLNPDAFIEAVLGISRRGLR
jgi:hypothetical protein